MKSMAAVQNQVVLRSARKRIRADQGGEVIFRRTTFSADGNFFARPGNRQVGKRFSDPGIAAWISEKNEIFGTQVVRSNFCVVFDGQIATHVARPFVGKASE